MALTVSHRPYHKGLTLGHSHTGPFEGFTDVQRSKTRLGYIVTTREQVPQKAKFAKCPKGSTLVGYYHTHPNGKNFSDDDLDLIKNLDIPTYMSQDGEEVKRADPMRTDDPKKAGISAGSIQKPDGFPLPPKVTSL